MSLPLIITKLNIPPSRSNWIPRERLYSKLAEGLSRKLTLVSAPPGFGKTTIVSQWISKDGYRPGKVLWVSLDRRDNDPQRFWRYFLSALARLDTQDGQPEHTFVLPENLTDDELVLTVESLVVRFAGEFSLILDDYHQITEGSIHNALAFLIEHLPANMHLCIISRVDPPLPLAQLRLQGQSIEVRVGDLRFTSEEAMRFLRQGMGLEISGEELSALDARIEGWIAGLKLAALTIRERPDPHEFIQTFAGTNRYIEDYLSEQVLGMQPQGLRDFLLQTSILERLTGSLCDAVTGRKDGLEMLEALERANLFLVPLDESRRWYRYHPMFAGFLQGRLRQTLPDVIAELHQRAAAWYKRNQMSEDAVQHALEARNFPLAGHLIEEVADRLFGRNEVITLVGWMKALPENLISARPQLCLAYAWTLALSGEVTEAEPWLQAAEKILINAGSDTGSVGTPSGADSQIIETPGDTELDLAWIAGTIDNIRSHIARANGNLSDAVEISQRALNQTPSSQMDERSVRLVLLGRAQFLEGHIEAASRNLAEAIQVARTGGIPLTHLSAVHYLAQLRIVQGRLNQAAQIYEEAQTYIKSLPEPVYAGIEYCGLASLMIEWNELDEAARCLDRGLPLAEAGGEYIFLRDGYFARARLAQARGDLEEALEYVQKVAEIVQTSQPSVDVSLVEVKRARLLLAQGNLESADRWTQACGLDQEDELSFVNEEGYLMLARGYLGLGRLEQAGRLLKKLVPFIENGNRTGRLIEVLMLQARWFSIKKDKVMARQALRRALILASPEGYIRTFLDEGPSIASLIRYLEQEEEAGDPEFHKYLARLISFFPGRLGSDGSSLPVPQSAQYPAALLSKRELQVLSLIAMGKTYQEISDELMIALSTVQTHVKNAYYKLDAHNGLEATARARQLNLIS